MNRFLHHPGKPRGGGILVLHADVSTIGFTWCAVGSDRALVRMINGRLDQLYAEARFHPEDAAGRTRRRRLCRRKPTRARPCSRVSVQLARAAFRRHACACRWPPGRGWRAEVLGSGPSRRAYAPIPEDARFTGAARQRACLLPIRFIAQRWPELPQVACFETAFYHELPVLKHGRPLLSSDSKRGVRRCAYGGLAFESVIDALPAVDERAARGKTIVVHISDCATLCALDGGRKVAMAAGFGDLAGLPGMRSRPHHPHGPPSHGTIAAGSGQVEALLRQRPELPGMSGLAGDLDRLVHSNEPPARARVECLLYRIGCELEALAVTLSGLDAIVFTGSARPHAIPIRAGICRRASWLGVDLDPAANQAGGPRLTRPGSRVSAWVIPADERLLVARRTQAVVG